MESFPIQHRCQTCRAPCCGNFKKVLSLMDSRLNIYKPIRHSKTDERIILHNTGNSPIPNSEFMNELNHYKELCPQCKQFIKKMRNLVSNITIIKIKEIRVICNNCKHFKTLKLCKRCNDVNITFIIEKENYCVHDVLNTNILTEVRSLLGLVEKDNKQMKHNTDSLEELLRMIRVKRRPTHTGDVNYKKISEMEVLKDKSEIEDLSTLQKVVCKKSETSKMTLNVQNANFSNEDLDFEKSCICKYVAKKLEKKLSPNNLMKKQSLLPNNISSQENFIKPENSLEVVNKKIRSSRRLPATKTKKKEKKSVTESRKQIKSKDEFVKVDENENSETFMKILMKRRKNKKRDDVYNLKRFERIDIVDRSSLSVKDENTSLESVYEESEHTVECEYLKLVQPTEMIKGTTIVQLESKEIASRHRSLKPLLFDVTHNFADKTESIVSTTLTIRPSNNKRDILSEDRFKKSHPIHSKYQLSNADYIENGWTVLPEYKIMRRMNIYKMVPDNSTFEWFTKHKDHKQMFYETGELLADINDGQGRWYYRDGNVALNFSKTTEGNSNKMYCVYDAVTKDKEKQRKVVPVLAYFDYMGLGLVYDGFGKIRLKYNQSEGILLDDRIGPPARWKWHTLNDPPSLVGVYQEKYLKPYDECLDKLTSDIKITKNNLRDEMSEIELNNSVRETIKKLSFKYNSIEIRSKVFKLNDYFSLKILSQSKIYLQFRDGERSLKLNVGMKLLSNEIVGMETIDVAEVVKGIDIKQLYRH